MNADDESDLDIRQVIIQSESDEWSDYNDSKEGEGIEDDSNLQINAIQGSQNNDGKGDFVKIECDIDVSEYNSESSNIIQTNVRQYAADPSCEKGFCHAFSKGKRKFVSMETKLEAIRKLDQGEKVRKVASELGVGEVTVGDWRRNRARIEKWCMEKCSEDASTSRKTMKRSDFEKTSEALFLWFSQERLKGIPISGPMLQEKALYFHKQLQDGDGNFTASVGWLDRWKKRYGVCRLTMCGEKLSLDLEAVETFQNKLHSLIKDENLTPDQLYNCDETGLKYKTLPSLPRQENQFLDCQKRKERVTILACCNASGQNKLPLMVIGKACYLESLKNISLSELPVSYIINKSSIIDRDIFKAWFFNEFVPKIEQFLKDKNLPRKAVLILDSASSHPSEEELVSDGIRTLFLPPAYTSLLQPMNQGILFCFKINYRKKLFEYLFKLRMKDSVRTYLKNIDLRDIVNHMADAWSEIPCEILVRSWKKLLTNSETLDEIDEVEDIEGKAYLISLLQKLPGYEYVDENILLQWFEQDDTYEVLSNYATETTKDESVGEMDSSKVVQNGIKQNKAFYVKGLAAMDVALHYIQHQEEATPDEILIFKKWRDFAQKKLSQFQK